MELSGAPCLFRARGSASEDGMTGTDLIRRMAEGDRAAFAAFYDGHARLVYPLIMRIVPLPSLKLPFHTALALRSGIILAP